MSVVESCRFLGIDQLYIGKSDINNNEYNSIILLDNKYYLKKYIYYSNDCYEIVIKPLEHIEQPKLNYFNKIIDDKTVTIKDDIYLLYSILCIDSSGIQKIERCTQLLYEKNDSIPFSEWINTLKAASFIDASFFERYRNIIFFENMCYSKNSEEIKDEYEQLSYISIDS